MVSFIWPFYLRSVSLLLCSQSTTQPWVNGDGTRWSKWVIDPPLEREWAWPWRPIATRSSFLEVFKTWKMRTRIWKGTFSTTSIPFKWRMSELSGIKASTVITLLNRNYESLCSLIRIRRALEFEDPSLMVFQHDMQPLWKDQEQKIYIIEVKSYGMNISSYRTRKRAERFHPRRHWRIVVVLFFQSSFKVLTIFTHPVTAPSLKKI